MADLSNKRIITVATTGAWPKTSNNPNLPTQPEEIAEEIYNCWKEGAAVAHIHIRDKEENDSMEVETFKAVLDNLQVSKAIVIIEDNDQNVVLSGRNIPDVITASVNTINTYDIMKYGTVIVTKDAVAKIEEVYA